MTTSGELAGLLAARDEAVGGLISDLEAFTQTFIFEFNKLYSAGQGLSGHSSLESEFAVDDAAAHSNQPGWTSRRRTAGFKCRCATSRPGCTKTTDIEIDLNGLGADTSLTDLAAAARRHRRHRGDDRRPTATADHQRLATIEFGFADDTSGVLAALGLNTFFTGTVATDIGISQLVRQDPSLFAASGGGIGEDSETAAELAICSRRSWHRKGASRWR